MKLPVEEILPTYAEWRTEKVMEELYDILPEDVWNNFGKQIATIMDVEFYEAANQYWGS